MRTEVASKQAAKLSTQAVPHTDLFLETSAFAIGYLFFHYIALFFT